MKRLLPVIAALHFFYSGAFACAGPSENLVLNPHFTAGDTGFTSTLPLGQNCQPGYYYVGSSMHDKCTIWPSAFVDHTTGTGNFLIVDGSDNYAPQDVWIESVPVLAGHTYYFSFWAKNLYTQYPFPLGFMVNGVQIATSANIAPGSWNLYATSYTAVANGNITLAIRQLTAYPWRDFGIDDVYFGECADANTGISENSQSAFSLFPDPASSIITLHSSAFLAQPYFIYDIAGQLVKTGSISGNETSFSIAELSDGIYFLQIREAEKIKTLKFIKTE